MAPPFQPLVQLSEALMSSGIPYFVVGSVASGVRGVFRSTNNIDVVCNLTNSHSLDQLLASLAPHFDCGLMDISAAVALSRSFNILHRESFTKIDVFSKLTDLEMEEFERAEIILIPESQAKIAVATAEYIILAKLCWYVLGNRVSERQMEDVRNVVAVNRETLEMTRLTNWARRLSLVEELRYALSA